MNNIKDYMVSGNIAAAKDICHRNQTPMARMIEKGLQRLGKPLKDIKDENERLRRYIQRMEDSGMPADPKGSGL